MMSLLSFMSLMLAGALCHGQYTVDWVANTYGDNAHHVGNCARSMWVDTNGMIYTASLWDENDGGIGIYQNGQTLGSMGAHGELQGCSIAGNATSIFAEEQGVNGGQVGRYNRTTHVREIMFAVSSTNGDSVPGLAISPLNGLLYASDKPGNRIRVFDTNGVWQQDWTVASPGTLTIDSAGNVWVAQMTNATVLEFSATGNPLNTISMNASSRLSALYVDSQNQLWVGDQGPDENIKIYTNLTTTPTLSSTYGVTGGYLSTANGAIKGQTGAKRFTRVVGIGADQAGNVYVLNNPWGGTWDLGRNGGTDLHCYNTSGSLAWTLQSLNFEGVAVEDPETDGTNLYSGEFIFSGSSGGGFLANTVDPFDYPNDERLDVANVHSRGEDFGMTAWVNSHRILIACGQDPDNFNSYYFNAANGYIAIPGIAWGTNHERNGFCLDSAGNVWEGRDKTSAIWFNQLTGFDTNGAPIYAPATSTPTPTSIAPMNRILYLPASDTMILAGGNPTDWTALGPVVQVYNGWMAGNTNNPNTVITLNTNLNPKTMAAAGGYLFVGYVHTVPNIDVFNLATGAFVFTMTNSATVYVGNDVDSMYGLSAYQKADGQYVITKDDYNGSAVVIYRWTPGQNPPPAPTGLTATPASTSQINLSWTASNGALSYNVKRSNVSGGPYTTIATGVTATDYSDAGLATATTYYYVVSAVNNAGEGANSTEANATTLSGLPNPWQTQDIGAVGVGGSASYDNSTSTFTVIGSGSDINGTADQFRYVYQTCGDTNTITARVVNMTTNSNSAAKAGVMFRETLATNAIEVSITLTPANGVTWQYRTATGGTTTGSRVAGIVTPYWVQLVRSASTFTGYASADGVTWTQEFTVNIPMADTAYTGLAVTSRNNSTTCTANFDNVSVSGGSGGIPAPPTGLAATAVNSSQINLSWTASSGATSYNVKRAAVSGGPYATIATGVTATTYSDTTAASGTTYYYVASAVNTGGESANSSEASATTIPAAPTGLTATAGNAQVALSWAASTGATSYNVKRATVSGGPYTTIAAGETTTSYTDATAVNGTAYYYVVSAVNATGESANSSQVSATPSAPATPNAPTSLTATGAKRKANLTWTQSSSPNITNNNVYRATVSGGPYSLVTTLSATTSYTDTGLTSGTTYYYVVTAVNSSNLESPDSNQASATAK